MYGIQGLRHSIRRCGHGIHRFNHGIRRFGRGPRRLRRCCIIAWIAAGLVSGAPPPGQAEPLVVTIIHVNDWDRMESEDGHGGAAKIAAAVKAERARAEAAGGLAVVTFGGDMISPSVLSGIDRGAHMIDLANAIGFDVAVPGNHEFDFGPEVLRARLAESSAVWLASNIDYQGRSGFPGTEATTMVEKAGYRLGFLGLLTPDTAEISAPGDAVVFLPQDEVAASLAAKLHAAGADLVIALTHNRTGADMALLRRVGGIDIVLGGHDHQLTAWYDGRQALLKAGSQGRHVGILNLTLERIEDPQGGPRVTWTPEYDLRSTLGVEADAEVAAMVARHEARLDRELGQVIGRTATELDTRGPVVRSGEAVFGNLLADALLAATGADIAITNGGGIRGGRVYPPGTELTPRRLLTELPFAKATVVLRLTGAQLREALENGVSRAEGNDGRFPQVGGLSFAFDVRRPPGSRVTRVEVGGVEVDSMPGGAAPAGGTPLDTDKTYSVATNDFMATGGDGYTVLQSAEVLIDATAGDTLANHLIDYVRDAGTVAPAIEGRIIRKD